MASQTNIEQRCVIKYFVKVNEKCNKVYKNLRNVYGDEAMSRTRVYESYNQFKNGREDVFDDERSGRPKTGREETNIIIVQELITEDKSLSLRDIEDITGINYQTVRRILELDLGLSWCC